MRKQKETHPPIGTREIDRLAAESYGGDTKALLSDYMHNGRSVKEFCADATQEEAELIFRLALRIRSKELGGKKQFEREVIFDMYLADLNMERDTFLSTDENPFKKPVLYYALGMLGIIAIGVLCVVCRMPTEAISALSSIAIGICSLSMAPVIMKCFKFKRLKKWYHKAYESPTVDTSAVSEEDDTL